ncbi:MAG: phospholipid carrier-dependent glycosyltransferase, partial [Defluviitaleaceae bacterium]|nr:phospholipid carrier-dependent glycosyltransferase [Defluviitaleaceae bacterium]
DGFNWALIDNSSIYFISAITVVLAVALILTVVGYLRGKIPAKYELQEDSLKNPPPMQKLDFALIAALIAVYSVIAFVNLGDRHTPQTTWISQGEVVHIDLGEMTHITQFQFLMGARHDIAFSLHSSVDGHEWQLVHHAGGGDVFAWTFVPINEYARFMAIGANEGLRLQEIAFRGADGEILPILQATSGAENLFDEQHLVPYRRTFMNSTYFDEIYHPRTGYEFVHGLAVFETTHPPLGKVIMAASINAFGMTPFAWRLPGTLFGIFMIPLIYAFARLLLKSNHMALFAAFIFSFDFMLFSHTRLATIDTFVTFFVLAMYFLMYMYVRGVSDNSLRKSLIILACCGAAMGLAIASKWQGVYGAIGLPILFFPALYKLFLRDKRQAMITFFACFGLFIALPIVIYTLSYIPFVNAQGGGGLRTIWENQELMLRYHSIYVLGSQHPFASPWWSWPLILTPLFQYQTILSPEMRQGMSSMGNPAVWWFGIVATAVAIYSFAKKRRHESDTVFLLVAYAANFLPWVFITRLTFIYHYFPSVPFVVLLITMLFHHHIKRPHRDYLCFAYAGVVLALFILFYPVLAGAPISFEFVQARLRWLPNWFFV